MPKTTTTTPTPETTPNPVIGNVTELNGVLRKMSRAGALGAKHRRLMEAELDKVRARFLPDVERHERAYAELEAQAEAFCRTQRERVLDGSGSKSRLLPHGLVEYRAARPRVVVDDTQEVIVERLMKAGFDQAVRLRAEIDRRVVLSHPEIADAVAGLRIERGEDTITITPATLVL